MLSFQQTDRQTNRQTDGLYATDLSMQGHKMEKMLVTSIVSFSLYVFKSLLLQYHYDFGLFSDNTFYECWKGLQFLYKISCHKTLCHELNSNESLIIISNDITGSTTLRLQVHNLHSST